ncbi:hypothetical protein ACTVJH_11640, partial [Desulfoplanes sp. PS50]
MKHLVVAEFGNFLGIRNGMLVVKGANREEQKFPLNRLVLRPLNNYTIIASKSRRRNGQVSTYRINARGSGNVGHVGTF